METRNLTCIGCPLGCAITVTMDGGNVVSITGNTCKRGSDYAAKEVTHPTRIVTSTVSAAAPSRWYPSRPHRIFPKKRSSRS